MKKIFVAAAIVAMFAAVSCKNDKKAAEAPAEAPAAEEVVAEPTVEEQLQNAAEEQIVEVGSAAIEAAGEKVLENL